jgi:hypothetical protein
MTTKPEIRNRYFQWLTEFIGTRTSKELLRHLFYKEYKSVLPNDDNRCLDGTRLRDLFEQELNILVNPISNDPCSFLEMLIGLAKRMSEDVVGDDDVRLWFWRMVKNAGYLESPESLWGAISKGVIERKYKSNGQGGLFPLKHPHQDQTKVEIWYQMMGYLEENS